MSIGSAHDARLKQSVVLINSHQCLNDEHDEAEVVHRSLARSVQQYAGIGSETPVFVFARTVDACERLLVQQYAEAMMTCNLLHERHEQHVVVDGKVGLLEDRSQLKLVGRNLVVACLAGDAQFESLDFQILHESLYTFRDSTEVVVVHLLVLCRVVTHKCASGEHEVGACRVQSFVNEEVLLLPTEVRDDLLHLRIEVVANLSCCYIHSMQRAQKRSLIVESLACV